MTSTSSGAGETSSSSTTFTALPNLLLTVPFQTKREAEIAYNSLRVDREPKRSQVTKTLELDGNSLKM